MIEYRTSGRFPSVCQQFTPVSPKYPKVTFRKSRSNKILLGENCIVVLMEDIISKQSAINTLSLLVDDQVIIKQRRKYA